MGTYTTNKNLFMPTVGETGWGTLVNGNFETIDTYLKPISLSGSTYTFTGNHVGNQSGGSISATSISNSGTLTQTGTSTFTGKITANGGIGTTSLTTSSTITSTGKITGNGGISTKALTATTGTFSGAVTGASFNGAPITSTKFNGVVLKSSGTITVASTSTIEGYLLPLAINYNVFPPEILPYHSGVKYSGSIKLYNPTTTAQTVWINNGTASDNSEVTNISINSKTAYTYTFTNIRYLTITPERWSGVQIYTFTLS